jgi:hypothetical protein
LVYLEACIQDQDGECLISLKDENGERGPRNNCLSTGADPDQT